MGKKIEVDFETKEKIGTPESDTTAEATDYRHMRAMRQLDKCVKNAIETLSVKNRRFGVVTMEDGTDAWTIGPYLGINLYLGANRMLYWVEIVEKNRRQTADGGSICVFKAEFARINTELGFPETLIVLIETAVKNHSEAYQKYKRLL